MAIEAPIKRFVRMPKADQIVIISRKQDTNIGFHFNIDINFLGS